MARSSAIHPDTNERVETLLTDALRDELDKFYKNECDHSSREMRTVKIGGGGATAIYYVCLTCGSKIGQAVPKKSTSVSPEIIDTEELENRYHRTREIYKFNLVKAHATRATEESRAFAKKWGQYLQSDEWRAKRQLVISRADYVCEGCGVEKATEVHHLTCERRFVEMLFDLVALCSTCHSLIHYEKNEKLRSNPIMRDEYRCLSCRFADSRGNTPWCSVFDAPASASLENPLMCHNGRNGFEGLR
jgi:hypothetical protein